MYLKIQYLHFFQVSLKIKDSNMADVLCAGTIVDTTNIITAASCLQQDGFVASTDNIKVIEEG